MAEVGQRLGTGAYRLTALRSSPSRPVCTRESPGSLRVTARNRRVKEEGEEEESDRDHREVQTLFKMNSKQRKSDKVSRVRISESRQDNASLHCATFLERDLCRFIGFVQTRETLEVHKTGLCFLSGLQPDLQDKLLPGRMRSWTRRDASAPPETLRSPQQIRAFCTVIFILRSERPGCRLRRTKPHPYNLSPTTRSYSWNGDSKTKNTVPLYRSRTAYYDILKVSPSATQSQIKTAYYKQSFIYHPDKNPGSKEATQMFSEISEAYTVLGSISLRRKYDRGILSQSDVQSAGRPSSKEATSRSTGSPQQQQQQQRARQFSQRGGKPMFDFDAFYQAHYGEQLQREQEMRARKQRMEEMQKENAKRWRKGKVMELTVAMLLAAAGLVFVNLSKS